MLGLVSLPYVTGILSPAVCQRHRRTCTSEKAGRRRDLGDHNWNVNFADQVEVIWVIINAKGVT